MVSQLLIVDRSPPVSPVSAFSPRFDWQISPILLRRVFRYHSTPAKLTPSNPNRNQMDQMDLGSWILDRFFKEGTSQPSHPSLPSEKQTNTVFAFYSPFLLFHSRFSVNTVFV